MRHDETPKAAGSRWEYTTAHGTSTHAPESAKRRHVKARDVSLRCDGRHAASESRSDAILEPGTPVPGERRTVVQESRSDGRWGRIPSLRDSTPFGNAKPRTDVRGCQCRRVATAGKKKSPGRFTSVGAVVRFQFELGTRNRIRHSCSCGDVRRKRDQVRRDQRWLRSRARELGCWIPSN